MKYILGISCFFHDSAACLVCNDEIIAAAEEERFTRKKHDNSFPENSIKFCLDKAKIKSIDLDAVVFYENPILKFDRVFKRLIKNFPKSLNIIKVVAVDWHTNKLWFKERCAKFLNIKKDKITFFDHHKSHLFSALIPSGLKESACLTIDGVGEWVTTEGSMFKNNQIKELFSIKFPHSLGILYSALTEFLGFEVNEGEYKVMGLAAYGEPIYNQKIEQLFKYRNENGFELDMSFFSFEYSMKTNLTEKFYKLFGEQREKESEFLKKEQLHPKKFELNSYQKYYADIAASLQFVMQDQIILFVKKLRKESGLDSLHNADRYGQYDNSQFSELSDMDYDTKMVMPKVAVHGNKNINSSMYVPMPHLNNANSNTELETNMIRGMPTRTLKSYGFRNPAEHYYGYMDPVYQNANNTVLPFPRGGDATRLENTKTTKKYSREIL